MDDKGLRYNKGKPKLSYVLEAEAAIAGAAKVMSHVVESGKYPRRNWKKGLPVTEIVDSMMRHMVDFMNGNDLDAEDGLPAVDHLLVNALFLSQMYHTQPEMDDRVVTAIIRNGDRHAVYVPGSTNPDPNPHPSGPVLPSDERLPSPPPLIARR